MFRPTLAVSLPVLALLMWAPGGRPQAAVAERPDLAAVLAPPLRWDPKGGWRVTGPLPPLTADQGPSLDILAVGRGDEVAVGEPADVIWQWAGDIVSVRLSWAYELCRLGGASRGKESRPLAGPAPNRGYLAWTPEWVDAPQATLRLDGYDDAGRKVASAERLVNLRPREARDLSGTFIVILRDRQRLYFFKDDRLQRMHLVSTARPGYQTPRMWPGMAHMGHVFCKDPSAYSNRYHCPMPYWLAITSSGSHGIHATTPSAYRHLGHSASHGCVRQHLRDARVLFSLVAVGTGVYVF